MSLATLTTVISTMLQKLSESFSARRAPNGYRPGVTLEYLRRNLGVASFASTGSAEAVFFLGESNLQVDVIECTESQLLMHLVMTEFSVRVPTSEQGSAHFYLHHSGSIRRTGLVCKQRAGASELLTRLQARLQEDSMLHRTLMSLDFKRLQLTLDGHEWHVQLEHMGGSEVVNRMPSFRRYIALSGVQRDLLLNVLVGLHRTLRTL